MVVQYHGHSICYNVLGLHPGINVISKCLEYQTTLQTIMSQQVLTHVSKLSYASLIELTTIMSRHLATGLTNETG